MFRSFLLFPLSLNIPGKGFFRKLIGKNKTFNDRPVYNHIETGEVIFFKGKIFLRLRLRSRDPAKTTEERLWLRNRFVLLMLL